MAIGTRTPKIQAEFRCALKGNRRRGAKRRGFAGILKDLVSDFNVGFLALLETHVHGSHAQVLARKIGLSGLAISEASKFAGGIWCFWDPSLWKVHVSRIEPQVVHLKVSSGQSGFWLLSICYGSPQLHSRRHLWEDLINFHNKEPGSWILLGGFNSILHPKEKWEEVLIFSQEILITSRRLCIGAWLTHPEFTEVVKDSWNPGDLLSANSRHLQTSLQA
ncbi:Endonuclease/exonuclease/phosphatase superfamily [Sesbania bispinosa]|nr:Endonuclease/exonuclease/phosphatase superfamily [Sesbania bispinosa]